MKARYTLQQMADLPPPLEGLSCYSDDAHSPPFRLNFNNPDSVTGYKLQHFPERDPGSIMVGSIVITPDIDAEPIAMFHPIIEVGSITDLWGGRCIWPFEAENISGMITQYMVDNPDVARALALHGSSELNIQLCVLRYADLDPRDYFEIAVLPKAPDAEEDEASDEDMQEP
jgi:hypothetical protein